MTKLIAFYLPQYHPIPENNAWWGKGFTEWTNVTKAKPRFSGHYQPHVPSDLGYYDLRMPEVRLAQAELARQYGIHGFCYYHYWFNGKQLLERPIQEVLRSGQPDFPFCICWANENWTRRWDGQENEVLIAQNYSKQDDINHIRALVPTLTDPRYIRYQGKPVVLIYRIASIPNPRQTTDVWREEYQKMGLGELYLCNVESSKYYDDPAKAGFDAAVEFQPDWRLFKKSIFWRIISRLNIGPFLFRRNWVMPYQTLIERGLKKPKPDYVRFPCVTPSWDNSARKKNFCYILTNSTPALYQEWLTSVIQNNKNSSSEEFVFINAWNEWGEGNHLEPDVRFGHGYLEATLNALKNNQ